MTSSDKISDQANISSNNAGDDQWSDTLAAFVRPQDAVQHLREKNINYMCAENIPALPDQSLREFWHHVFESLQKIGLRRPHPANTQGENIVFIVGLPRSGKTSLEKILNELNPFYGADELLLFSQMFKSLRSPDGTDLLYPDYLQMIPDDVLEKMGNDYTTAMYKDVGHSDKIIINTMPPNFIYIPLIHCMLPKAKIIWCHRDPKIHCITLFQKQFDNSIWNFTYNMDLLVQTYNDYRALHRFYKQHMPHAFIDVDYEDVIKDSKKAIQSVLEQMGHRISNADIKKAITKHKNFLLLIEKEQQAYRNYTPYFHEFKNLRD